MHRAAHIFGLLLVAALSVAMGSAACAQSHHHGHHHAAAHHNAGDHQQAAVQDGETAGGNTTVNTPDARLVSTHKSAIGDRSSRRDERHVHPQIDGDVAPNHQGHDQTDCWTVCLIGMGECPSTCCVHDQGGSLVFAPERRGGELVTQRRADRPSPVLLTPLLSPRSGRSPPHRGGRADTCGAERSLTLRLAARLRI